MTNNINDSYRLAVTIIDPRYDYGASLEKFRIITHPQTQLLSNSEYLKNFG